MDRIVTHPDICNGRPTIRGTRIAAQTVVEFLAAGDTVDDVLAAYPTLTRDDVLACLRFSAGLLGHRLHALPLDDNLTAS